MRATPRTWPSMRDSREMSFGSRCVIALRSSRIYPLGYSAVLLRGTTHATVSDVHRCKSSVRHHHPRPLRFEMPIKVRIGRALHHEHAPEPASDPRERVIDQHELSGHRHLQI